MALPLRDIGFIASDSTIGFLAVVFNSLVVLVIVRTHVLHTVTNTFICSLALADIGVGLFVVPLSTLSSYGVPGNFYGCLFISCVRMIFTNVSILMLVAIALDRFFAIKEPFVYHKVMSMRKAYFISGVMWVIGVNTGLTPFYVWHTHKEISYCRFNDVIDFEYLVFFHFFGVILPAMTIMFMANLYIWIVVLKQLRVIGDLKRRFATASEMSLARRWYYRDLKASKMIVLPLALLFCRMPLQLTNCVFLLCKTCTFQPTIYSALIQLHHFNSVVNPILYAITNSSIRKALAHMTWEILCSCKELRPPAGWQSSSSPREVPSRSIVSAHIEIGVDGKISRSSSWHRKVSTTTV